MPISIGKFRTLDDITYDITDYITDEENEENEENDDNLIMLYINSQANTQRGITFGYTAEYMTRFSGRIQEPKIGLKGGVRVRVGESLGEFVTCQDAGYLITATLSS